MQIKHVDGMVRLVFADGAIETGPRPCYVELSVQEALQLRADLGPAVREGNKQPPTDYLKLSIEEAIRYGAETRHRAIAKLEEELKRLREGGDPRQIV